MAFFYLCSKEFLRRDMINMLNYLVNVQNNVKIDEGEQTIKNVLINIYLNEGISNKKLSRLIMLPIPIIVAIKKEFIKQKLVIQDKGIRLTTEGIKFVEEQLGFKTLNIPLYKELRTNYSIHNKIIVNLRNNLTEVFANRPQVDVSIDQTKCTIDTAINRAILCLKHNLLIDSKILCIGDDDLISVTIGFLLKNLYDNLNFNKTKIIVLDIDKRIIEYINKISNQYNLPIECYNHDFRKPIPKEYISKFDCIFTDPPYTLNGMNLFLSRGIEGIKRESGQHIFLSYAHKSISFEYDMQKSFLDMGLIVSEIIHSFNHYEGAGILGNIGKMIILKTTSTTKGLIVNVYNKDIYTGQLKKTIRYYKCKSCNKVFKIGKSEKIKTVEELKIQGCLVCHNQTFILSNQKII